MPAALTYRHVGSHNTTRPALSNCRQGASSQQLCTSVSRRTAAMAAAPLSFSWRRSPAAASEQEQAGTIFLAVLTNLARGRGIYARKLSAAACAAALQYSTAPQTRAGHHQPSVSPWVRTETRCRRGAFPHRRFSGAPHAPSARILYCYSVSFITFVIGHARARDRIDRSSRSLLLRHKAAGGADSERQ